MAQVDNLLEALDEMPTHQLEQLNRLLDAVRRYLPRENLSPLEARQRSITIGTAVARLRAGITDNELDAIIHQLRTR
jgi:hypothetical protein